MQKQIQKRAQELRKNMTIAEKKLWNILRHDRFNGLRFRRQVPLGSYIVDFACFEAKIIIELDGSQHLEQMDYDENRTRYLEMLGYKVLRFWNREVLNNIDAVLEVIWECVYIPPSDLRPPSP